MEFRTVLDRLDEQIEVSNISAKLFRYTGLMHAIEFLSQRLNIEQILDAGFDFFNELLSVEKSAIFINQGNEFTLKKIKGFNNKIANIKCNNYLKNYGSLNGALINDKKHLEMFFGLEIVKEFSITIAVPLIIYDTLYGFIFLANKTIGEFSGDDYIISEALMRLVNNALENYNRYEELQKANRELDEKIFNLFAINQSSKALLSELSLESLYTLSVDVFSELTQNTITGFVLYDDMSERYVLKAHKDIYNLNSFIQVDICHNKSGKIDLNHIIINTSKEKDINYFNSLFADGISSLMELKAEYIVLLIKSGKILGFVTLGKSIMGNRYKESMFELIESLAAATYIAVSNAQLLKQVNQQKEALRGKVIKLTSLNNLMKNINSSENIDILLELTMKTLNVSFQVDKALIALTNNKAGVFEIRETLNIEVTDKIIKTNSLWKRVLEGDSIFQAKEEGIPQYISSSLASDIGKCPGLLIVPIYIDKADIEMIGVIIIFKYKKGMINDEENILIMETIAGHIAPVISNLSALEKKNRILQPNFVELFKRDLKREIAEAVDYDLNLEVLHITGNNINVLNTNSLAGKLKKRFKNVYPITYNETFIINNNPKKGTDNRLNQFLVKNNITAKKYVFGHDFINYKEFISLYKA